MLFSFCFRKMWALTTKERKILKKIIPTEFRAQQIECPNGGAISLEELIKRDRISANEVEAIYKGMPEKDIEFYKFVNSLRPYRKSKSDDEELTDEQKKAKQKHRERTQKLKDRQANLEYSKMVESIDSYRVRPLLENFGQEMREVNRQIIAVTNTLITVGGAFAFGFWGIEFAYPHLNLDIAERMLMGLVFATIVFFADLYFIVKGMDNDNKIEEKKK